MPFTPFHFGPAGLVGLPFYKKMDLPLFVLANVAIDIEVLIDMKYFPGIPVHNYCHTLIGAAVVGIILAVIAYPFRKLTKKFMALIMLDYNPTFGIMLIGAVLGAWWHIIIDAFCWFDVGIFWPLQRYNTLYSLIGPEIITILCIASFLPMIIIYIINAVKNSKRGAK